MNPECPKDSYESRIDARGLESVEIGSIVGAGGFTWYGGEENFVLHGDGWGSIEVGECDGGRIPIPSASACGAQNRARVFIGFWVPDGPRVYWKFGNTQIQGRAD